MRTWGLRTSAAQTSTHFALLVISNTTASVVSVSMPASFHWVVPPRPTCSAAAQWVVGLQAVQVSALLQVCQRPASCPALARL